MRGERSKVGETRVTQNGYHETRTADKWERTARIVMAKYLGRPLGKNEWVRHRDGDKLNHNKDNLYIQVVSQNNEKITSTDTKSHEERISDLEREVRELKELLNEMRHLS